jgi:putative transposase
MKQQARNMAMFIGEQPVPPKYLIQDNDGKFVKEFDAILKDEGVTTVRIVPRSPNMNAYAERFVGSIKGECLSQFMVFGLEHLRYLIKEYLIHYHQERAHQGVGNVLLSGTPPPPVARVTTEDVVCEERLGGLLKHYRRAS